MQRFTYVISLHGLSDIYMYIAVMLKLKLNLCELQSYISKGPTRPTMSDMSISRFDISASGIGFDLNTTLFRPGLVESTCRAHLRSE